MIESGGGVKLATQTKSPESAPGARAEEPSVICHHACLEDMEPFFSLLYTATLAEERGKILKRKIGVTETAGSRVERARNGFRTLVSCSFPL